MAVSSGELSVDAHTCALLSDGTVKCWGGAGGWGYGNKDDQRGPPSLLDTVSITTSPNVTVTQLVAGADHTCALLSDSTVKCWGGNEHGQLGLGNMNTIGDDELPSSVGPVSVTTTPGVTLVQLAAGSHVTCAVLSDGTAKCWGENFQGELGYGILEHIGDDELPSSVGPIRISTTPGVTVKQIVTGFSHTCALLSDGSAKCWGRANHGEWQRHAPNHRG